MSNGNFINRDLYATDKIYRIKKKNYKNRVGFIQITLLRGKLTSMEPLKKYCLLNNTLNCAIKFFRTWFTLTRTTRLGLTILAIPSKFLPTLVGEEREATLQSSKNSLIIVLEYLDTPWLVPKLTKTVSNSFTTLHASNLIKVFKDTIKTF